MNRLILLQFLPLFSNNACTNSTTLAPCTHTIAVAHHDAVFYKLVLFFHPSQLVLSIKESKKEEKVGTTLKYFLNLVNIVQNKCQMKNIDVSTLKVTSPIKLVERTTHLDLDCSEKKKEKELQKIREKLIKLQDKMYAHNKYGVLICLQG